MKTSAKFKEYVWLVNVICRARRITFAEIQEKWLDSDLSEGLPMARSTFNRNKDAIEDIFGICIDCDRNNGYRYFIGNEEVLKENSVQNWMLSTLSVNNIIRESLSLQDRILLEPVPSDGEFLQLVVDAMKRMVRIELVYRKYGSEVPKVLLIEPYCIKLFKQRWYVLGCLHRDSAEGKNNQDYFAVFSFDRIREMRLTDASFEMDPDFDAKAFFSESYGVFVEPGGKAERIVLRAFGRERFYMRDLQIHPSQREIAEGDDFADFELFICPTMDFRAHICGRGSQLKVLAPQWLAEEIGRMLREAANLYVPDGGQ